MPYTQAQLEATLVAINTSLESLIATGFLESYTLPVGVSVKEGMTAEQLMKLAEYYQKLLRSYYPTMAISRGY